MMAENDTKPPMPMIEAGEYLLKIVYDIGPFIGDGMGGKRPITAIDLVAYNNLFNATSEPWEARAVLDMSRAYLQGFAAGGDEFVVSPMDRD